MLKFIFFFSKMKLAHILFKRYLIYFHRNFVQVLDKMCLMEMLIDVFKEGLCLILFLLILFN